MGKRMARLSVGLALCCGFFIFGGARDAAAATVYEVGPSKPYANIGDGGATQSYTANASAIYVEKGEHITVRDCLIHDSGNGFFVASSDAVSRDILVEGNHIYDNGNTGSIFEHNDYTAAVGIVFQYNRFGPLRAGASGNNLKDRSAGTVVRYNWIEGGN